MDRSPLLRLPLYLLVHESAADAPQHEHLCVYNLADGQRAIAAFTLRESAELAVKRDGLHDYKACEVNDASTFLRLTEPLFTAGVSELLLGFTTGGVITYPLADALFDFRHPDLPRRG